MLSSYWIQWNLRERIAYLISFKHVLRALLCMSRQKFSNSDSPWFCDDGSDIIYTKITWYYVELGSQILTLQFLKSYLVTSGKIRPFVLLLHDIVNYKIVRKLQWWKAATKKDSISIWKKKIMFCYMQGLEMNLACREKARSPTINLMNY